MCGIVGYVGARQATPILVGGLRKLEYRGYDSAGVSVWNDGVSRVVRCRGKGHGRRIEPGDIQPTGNGRAADPRMVRTK